LIDVSMMEAGRRGAIRCARGVVETGFGSAGARKGVELTGGPHMAVT
jgi:hypothetical protein